MHFWQYLTQDIKFNMRIWKKNIYKLGIYKSTCRMHIVDLTNRPRDESVKDQRETVNKGPWELGKGSVIEKLPHLNIIIYDLPCLGKNRHFRKSRTYRTQTQKQTDIVIYRVNSPSPTPPPFPVEFFFRVHLGVNEFPTNLRTHVPRNFPFDLCQGGSEREKIWQGGSERETKWLF